MKPKQKQTSEEAMNSALQELGQINDIGVLKAITKTLDISIDRIINNKPLHQWTIGQLKHDIKVWQPSPKFKEQAEIIVNILENLYQHNGVKI